VVQPAVPRQSGRLGYRIPRGAGVTGDRMGPCRPACLRRPRPDRCGPGWRRPRYPSPAARGDASTPATRAR
jgi:hypothetical protein